MFKALVLGLSAAANYALVAAGGAVVGAGLLAGVQAIRKSGEKDKPHSRS